MFTDCFYEMERNLYFQGSTPPQIDALAFITDYVAQSQVVNFTKIHVPSGCKDAYVNAITSANSLYAQYASIIVDDL